MKARKAPLVPKAHEQESNDINASCEKEIKIKMLEQSL